MGQKVNFKGHKLTKKRIFCIMWLAFWNLYVPGCTEHYFVHQVRKSRDYIPELDLKTLTVPLSRWKKDINIHKNYSIFIQDPMYAPDVF